MCSVNHQHLPPRPGLGQFFEDAFEHAVFGPSLEPVVERLVWSIVMGCIDPLQPVLDDINNLAQNLSVIGALNPTFLGKELCHPFNLFFRKPIDVTWAILATVNHKSETKESSLSNGCDAVQSEFAAVARMTASENNAPLPHDCKMDVLVLSSPQTRRTFRMSIISHITFEQMTQNGPAAFTMRFWRARL